MPVRALGLAYWVTKLAPLVVKYHVPFQKKCLENIIGKKKASFSTTRSPFSTIHLVLHPLNHLFAHNQYTSCRGELLSLFAEVAKETKNNNTFGMNGAEEWTGLGRMEAPRGSSGFADPLLHQLNGIHSKTDKE
ncbi:hypothetical protein CEXT_814751 [Caerostris extrusa]|uniref:Uncharacterized protein n=1 Tax=Caerostris extrusa TaxID=172846 RepID=A0AAV4RXM5_CAEEX|nr:hypothetical protein CEXT_814751 [Caerostris extrusa]